MKATAGLLPSLHQGFAPSTAGCVGFTECCQAAWPAAASTALKMSLETEKAFPAPAAPSTHTCFLHPHVISGELSLQLEANQQLGI